MRSASVRRPSVRALALAALAAGLGCAPGPEAAGAGGAATRAGAIIGGAPASPGDDPTVGALLLVARRRAQVFGALLCTGTLVAPDVVLTAAHCTLDPFGGASDIVSEYHFALAIDVSDFGRTTTDLPASSVRVRRLVAHPSFDANVQPAPGLGAFHDVGLLFLEAPRSDLTPEVVADDADGRALRRGLEVEISGYGQTAADDANTAGAKFRARTVLNEVGPSELQIGDRPPVPQKCHGDSGGPTFLALGDGRSPARRLIGITSRAYDDSDCNRGGIDTRADAYRGWVDGELAAGCADGSREAAVCVGWGSLPQPGEGPAGPDGGLSDSGVAESDAGVSGEDAADGAAPDAAGDGGDDATADGGRRAAAPRERSSSCACSAGRAGPPGGAPGAVAGLVGCALLRRARGGRRRGGAPT